MKINPAITGFLIVALCGMAIAVYMISGNKKLEVYNPDRLDSKIVDPSMRSKMTGHRVGSFALVNQFGKTITERDFENKIYVSDFFFTTCPGICKAMSKQMKRVQDANAGSGDFLILSHTVQPEIDSPAVLLEYANNIGADPEMWIFATADRRVIFDLARKTYFAATLEEGSEDEMVHTENFVLVDKEKRIRGIYDGTSEEDTDRLIDDINLLRKEYE